MHMISSCMGKFQFKTFFNDNLLFPFLQILTCQVKGTFPASLISMLILVVVSAETEQCSWNSSAFSGCQRWFRNPSLCREGMLWYGITLPLTDTHHYNARFSQAGNYLREQQRIKDVFLLIFVHYQNTNSRCQFIDNLSISYYLRMIMLSNCQIFSL